MEADSTGIASRAGRTVARVSYTARQISRMGFYIGHRLAIDRAVRRQEATSRAEPTPPPKADGAVPDRAALLKEIRALLQQDLIHSEQGYYPTPRDHDGSLVSLVKRSRLLFKDLPRSTERRLSNHFTEAREEASLDGLPAYYRQNFHFQSGGWLTDDSARLYDMQVEILFSGTANAMRRAGLIPLYHALHGRDQRDLRAADLATGTGSMLQQIGDAFPRLPVTGLDLSLPYLARAEKRSGHRPHRFVLGNAECSPFGSGSLDIVTAVFLFHELPPKVRRTVIADIARILKPGGTFIFVDALQNGDKPGFDGLLSLFPQMFHEPYFDHYRSDDLTSVFADYGLEPIYSETAFLSKVTAYRKA
ncbi:class I SAM-dependent methyltransferase [Coralliovum pocilloporae]|uniref:class I SAM-dependent methyltransferase n=1 Tax=Coralliovum pocilloporae TaxID=3066369 RepID=UPI003306ABA2